MKKEMKYFSGLLGLFFFSTYFLFSLLRKHSDFGFERFVESCQRVIGSVSSHGNHTIGLALLILAFLMGAIFCLKLLFSYLKTERKFKELIFEESENYPVKILKIIKSLKIDKSILGVIKTDSDFAATVGVFRPKVIISTSVINKLSKGELESVVLHELYHQQNRHGLLLILSEVISSSLFFLPLMKEVVKSMRNAFEKEADRFVVGIQKSNISLGLALSKVKTSGNFTFAPEFSGRREYKVNKVNILLSLIVFFLGITLYFIPSNTLANAGITNIQIKCGENMCSTNCDSQNETGQTKSQNMSYLVLDR